MGGDRSDLPVSNKMINYKGRPQVLSRYAWINKCLVMEEIKHEQCTKGIQDKLLTYPSSAVYKSCLFSVLELLINLWIHLAKTAMPWVQYYTAGWDDLSRQCITLHLQFNTFNSLTIHVLLLCPNTRSANNPYVIYATVCTSVLCAHSWLRFGIKYQ